MSSTKLFGHEALGELRIAIRPKAIPNITKGEKCNVYKT